MPGFTLQQHERVATLVDMVGGQRKAASIAGVSSDTINNWRKPEARLPLDGLLPLCQEAGLSLDWVATGYQVRPDLGGAAGLVERTEDNGSGSRMPLQPLRPDYEVKDDRRVELWTPSPIAFDQVFLTEILGTSAETARYAYIDDDGMAPILPRGAMVVAGGRSEHPRSGLYLVELGEELLPRRLNRMPDGRAELVADADLTWRYLLPDHPPPLYPILWCARLVPDR